MSLSLNPNGRAFSTVRKKISIHKLSMLPSVAQKILSLIYQNSYRVIICRDILREKQILLVYNFLQVLLGEKLLLNTTKRLYRIPFCTFCSSLLTLEDV